MPLRFSSLCALLSDLESYANHDPPLLKSRLEEKSKKRIANWFTSYRISSASMDVDLVALLSAFFPERRKDRVYGLKSRKLARSLRRVLHLGCGRWPLLDEWDKPGRGDLADCVERVLLQAEHPKQPVHREVTLEEVDAVLSAVAQKCRFSSPQVRAQSEDSRNVNELLDSIYHRLQSKEAKWLTRMILTEYPPLFLPECIVFRMIDRRLPESLRMHDNFEAALGAIRGAENTEVGPLDSQGVNVPARPRPKIGVKIGRPQFLKARSIKNAFQLAQHREMYIERKYDGEYCQVHIDLNKGDRWIQIFSKSGKDSTRDRFKLHQNIREALRIGRDGCQISQKCIIEGEMVVWDDRANDILEFCKIRKHVSRSGSFLGNKEDSQAHDYEHLMIFFYDVLMIDDEPILERPMFERRIHMERLIRPIAGRAGLAENVTLDFSKAGAVDRLRGYLAEAFAKRWEGLVMKPADESYIGSGQSAAWVKLKKDYIPGLGDTADFAIVGASYDQASAARSGIRDLKWTHFHLGCLFNPDEVAHGGKPYFAVLDTVSWGVKPDDLRTMNQLGIFRAIEADSPAARDLFRVHTVPSLPKMVVIFKKPFIFEVLGGGFDKPSNSAWYTLRWPRVLKIHQDRGWKDAVCLEQLQQMALEARTFTIRGVREEIEGWSKKLDRIDRRSQSVMLPWDDTQEKWDQASRSTVFFEHIPPTITKDVRYQTVDQVKKVRRPSKQTTTPMIRMDSNEMLPGERRANNGEVTMRSTSQGTNNSLPTPPFSSPVKTSPRDCKQVKDQPDSLHISKLQTLDKACLLQTKSLPSRQPKATRSGQFERHIKTTGAANKKRKRMVSRDHPSDDDEDVMLGYVIKKTRIHMEDRRRELSRREQEAKSMQTPLQERKSNAVAPLKWRLSFYADPLPEKQESAFLIPQTAAGAQEQRDRIAKPVLRLSSLGYHTNIVDGTTQETRPSKMPTGTVSASSDTESLRSVIPETPQRRASPVLDSGDVLFQNWSCVLGYSLSSEVKARARNQLDSRNIPYVDLPVWSAQNPPIHSLLPADSMDRDMILLVDLHTGNEPDTETVDTNELNAFIHYLDQRTGMKGSIWDVQCLDGADPDRDVKKNHFVGDVVVRQTKQATVTWKAGEKIRRFWVLEES